MFLLGISPNSEFLASKDIEEDDDDYDDDLVGEEIMAASPSAPSIYNIYILSV